jgi:hypothetical protein
MVARKHLTTVDEIEYQFQIMKTALRIVAGVCALQALQGGVAHADRRMYGETYEAVTAPKGELDVEAWTTYARLGEIDGGPASRGVRQMVELEYGITDHWDMALYNMFDAIIGGDTASGYAGAKLETRWRPLYRGQWIVDPVFYLELQELFRGDADQKLEAKLILARDFGPLNTAVNVSYEEERLSDPGHTLHGEIEYAAGTAWSFGPRLSIGAEVFGKAERESGATKDRSWVGPAISTAWGTHGALRGLWVTFAAGTALTSDSDRFYGRVIVGLQF